MALRTALFDKFKSGDAALLPLAVFAALGVFYLLHKILSLQGDESYVFRMIWIAGKMWSSGANPYGPEFLAQYQASGSGPVSPWNYPPYWYPIAVPLSHLPLPVAAALWKAMDLVLLVVATHLVARALADISRRSYAGIFALGLGAVCFMQAVAVTIFNGQTSIIVYFGLSALVYGLLKRRPQWVFAGLICLALKPQIGVVAFAAIAALPRYRWAVLLAGGACILAIVPNMITGDVSGVIHGFLQNIAEYSGRETANNPFNGIGLRHLLIYMYPAPASRGVLIVLSSIVAFAIFYLSTFNDAPKKENANVEMSSLALFLAALFFITPLQSYDIVALVILVMMIWAFRFPGRWIVAAGLALCIRAGNLSVVTGIANPESRQFPESLLVSLSLCIILSGALWARFATSASLGGRASDEMNRLQNTK